MTDQAPAYHYQVIARALREIDAAGADGAGPGLTLDRLAARMGMSPAHFQRVFSAWVGVSPKRYQQYLALDHARSLLARRFTVLDTSLATGLSGGGRLHDLFLRWEAMSPGDYARGGAGLTIRWGWFDSPFGPALVTGTDKGLCGLAFAAETGEAAACTYIVSMTRGPEDLLRVLLLAREAGLVDLASDPPESRLDVVPLFETHDALTRATAVMRSLLDDPVYQRQLQARGRRAVVDARRPALRLGRVDLLQDAPFRPRCGGAGHCDCCCQHEHRARAGRSCTFPRPTISAATASGSSLPNSSSHSIPNRTVSGTLRSSSPAASGPVSGTRCASHGSDSGCRWRPTTRST